MNIKQPYHGAECSPTPMNKQSDKPVIMTDEDVYTAALKKAVSFVESDKHKAACFDEMLAALEGCTAAFKDTATKDGGVLYQKASTAYESALLAIQKAKGGKA